MIFHAQQNCLLVGMAPDLINKGIAVLQYADHTVICLDHSLEKCSESETSFISL